MNALVSTALWVVGKALAPVTNGVLEDWDNSKNLSLNVEALKTELLYVKFMLETARCKHVAGQAAEELLCRLQDSARSAEDLLDELDYFRIHDQLHGTHEAADRHPKGGVHNLAFNARHTATAVFGLSSAAAPAAEPEQAVENSREWVGCCAWPRARHRSRGNSSSTPNTSPPEDDLVSECMPKLGKLVPRSSSPNVHDGNSGGQSSLCGSPKREHAEETPMLRFDRVDVSERMKQIVEQLQPMRREFTTILQSCDRITAPDIAQSCPITTGRSVEPKLYGRCHVMNNIIHDMTKGKYYNKDLSVLSIVGPGGIGKTTLIQHIYHNEEVQKHFQVVIWVCVSLKFNLNKLLAEIKTYTPQVEGGKDGTAEEVIEQRLKSKRFLLVLDDIWEFSDRDDWKRLLLPLGKSQEKGSMIILTTRFPAIANMVKTTDHIDLEGLESEEFRKLFLAFVFGDEPVRSDLLETGDKIMEKLKGSPLAAKTVGTLLGKELNLRHWIRVLESKDWERQDGASDIMPALKLSYDYLPFHQKQCFSYSALYPEDYKYTTTELINFWIGLDILQPGGWNKTLEEIGLSTLTDLVIHGFFREEETNGHPCYVMHDLLHDLALQVAFHDCISLHSSNTGSIEIQPSIRHLSIIIDDDTMSHENFKSELRKLKTRLKVEQLHTLMLFGKMDESFENILGDLFSGANALRILRLVKIPSLVESMLNNFSGFVHLRYLCLGTERELHFPLAISRFYHLRILDMKLWYDCGDLPKDLSNLAKLCRFYTPSDELHSNIPNVGKLALLEELKIFRVNKETEGFELKQLEHLNELRELGIYNLENIDTKEEAAKANLIEKNYLERLTLDWDFQRSNIKPDVEADVLESLKPYRYLGGLCIRGHGGPSCPTWLGDKLAVEALESLHLDGVSWQCLPSLGKMWGLREIMLKHISAVKGFVIEQSFCMLKRLELAGLESFEKWVPSHDSHMFPLLEVLIIRHCPKLLELPLSNHIVYSKPDQVWNIDWFPKLQELEIENCPEFMLVAHIPWTETLCFVNIQDVKLVQHFRYESKSYFGVKLKIEGKDGLKSLDQVLAFSNLTAVESLELDNCPPLERQHLRMLTSLKRLLVLSSDGLVGPLRGDVEWQLPVEYLEVMNLRGAIGKELTELLTHLPRLSTLEIIRCENIKQLAVGVDVTSTATSDVKKEEDGLLLFPAHLSDSLRYLDMWCPELVLVDPSAFRHALRSLETLDLSGSPKFLSDVSSFSYYLFPSSLQELQVYGSMGLRVLSNLTSLTRLFLYQCADNLRCEDLGPLLNTGGQLRKLVVREGPRFFAGWDPNPRRALQQDDGGEEQELQQLQPVSLPAVCSSKLQELVTHDAVGLLVVPICSFLSSSLTELQLNGDYSDMERFTEEQEDALLLLSSLQQLEFRIFDKLQHLPSGLHKLTNLKRFVVWYCPAVRLLPKDGLPKSLQELEVLGRCNEDLKQQCRGLVGTIPKILLD